MDIDTIIKDKVARIEDGTGNRVVIIYRDNIEKSCVDWPSWNKLNLPEILFNKKMDKVHLLHELIHLEMFFIDGYKIIVHHSDLGAVDYEVKNITENYVAHHKINNLGVNPIGEKWFKDNSRVDYNQTIVKIAEQLVYQKCFSYFRKEKGYFQHSEQLFLEVQLKNIEAYKMAIKVLDILDNVDYNNTQSYNDCLQPIIDIMVPQYKDKIAPALIVKKNGLWNYDYHFNNYNN